MRKSQNGPLMRDWKRSLKGIDKIVAAGKSAGRKPAMGHVAVRAASRRRTSHR